MTIQSQFRLPEKFILFVGSIEPRKNLKTLLLAYQNFPQSIRREYKLVLVGFKGWRNEQVMSLIGKLKEDVRYIGYLPEGGLGKIYNLAQLFAYPAYYEGFGLPPLEAMACASPVIASNAASLPEVCGEAAYYIDPHDVQSLTDGLFQCLTMPELRQSLKERALQQSQQYSWEKTAQGHLHVFEKLRE